MTRPSSQTSSRTADDARAINASLQRSQTLLKHELERVSHVSQAIQHDGQLLGATKDTHAELSDLSKSANRALRELKLQQQKERLVFMSAVVFYILVVLYVLWTRIPLFGVDYILGLVWRGGRMAISRITILKDYASDRMDEL